MSPDIKTRGIRLARDTRISISTKISFYLIICTLQYLTYFLSEEVQTNKIPHY
jgi:hypothetical protein